MKNTPYIVILVILILVAMRIDKPEDYQKDKIPNQTLVIIEKAIEKGISLRSLNR